MEAKAMWSTRRLGDLAEFRNGVNYNSSSFGEGIKVVGVSDFQDYTKPRYAELDQINPEGIVTARNLLRDGDIVFVRSNGNRELIGRSLIIEKPPEEITHSAFTIRLRFTSRETHPKFFAYCFRTPLIRKGLTAFGGGTNISNLNQDILNALEVPFPPLLIQRRIATILSAYDELMENCHRRIRLLEEMARALYREWFVHFRFPGHEKVPRVDSPHGPIPKGWDVKKLGELAEDMRRNVPKGELDEPQPFVGLEHIPRRSLALDAWEMTTDLGSNKLEFKKGEVLFGKIRPYFHKVSIAPFDGLCSADTIVIRARRAEHYAFVVACVSSDDFVAHATATSNGSKMPRANWHVLEEYNVVIPPREIATRFSDLLCNALAEQQTLIFKIQNLRRTRDLLLPRLLSGQVPLDVSEDVAEPTTSAPPPPARPARSQVALGNAPLREVELRQTDPATGSAGEAKLRGERRSRVQLGNEQTAQEDEEPASRVAEAAPPRRAERASHGQPPPAEPADDAPVPIHQTERTDVLQIIRQVFSEGPPRPRDDAIRDVARALGYRRTGARIQSILHADLLTAVRRGILENTDGTLRLGARSIADYHRDFLKAQFLAAIGRPWIARDTATRDFCRWLGFARTGPIIEDTARSLINGLLREGRLEADGAELIRRVGR